MAPMPPPGAPPVPARPPVASPPGPPTTTKIDWPEASETEAIAAYAPAPPLEVPPFPLALPPPAPHAFMFSICPALPATVNVWLLGVPILRCARIVTSFNVVGGPADDVNWIGNT